MNKKVIIFNSFDYGSTGVLCGYLKESKIPGFDETLLVCSNKKKNKNADYYLYDNTTKIYRKFALIKAQTRNMYGFVGNTATKKCLDFINSCLQGDEKLILSLHQLESSFFNLEAILDFAYNKHAKVFITLHDCWLFTGKCPYYDLSCCKEWEVGCTTCSFKNEFPKTLFRNIRSSFNKKISLILKYSNFITLICPSYWMFDQLEKSLLKNVKKVVIHNGIEIEGNKQSLKNNCNAKIGLIAAASPWSKRKGLIYLQQLSNKLDFNRFSLSIAGCTKQPNFSEKTTFLGVLDRQTLLRELDKNDYFLNPTLEENFPTTNIEALSHGLKIIAFNSGGACEAFDEKTGYCCEEKNVDSLFKITNSLNTNTDKDKCIDRATSLFSKDLFVSKYYNLFNYEDKK